ncbi:MAG: hypothetical protein A2832_00260 [Candidatus Zambryskibacteria bacterium RIFCSPHIGHO2_01_FULL_44_22b]|uniref:Uncharacterized protein n=2 Tax=Candidatus Zambryskiibacteriota TaxID=1817925 RepID=A0A1G2T141_9BACT|nr:MAG: hypothetical protein A2832_00260 [Candidatus Zambryskibacteria bacterium RIFCSPHIGHO2_01_FULL_44_22b]OHB05478.1 MAG: hypothetical protein A3B16_01120 [Candidatus Zambryskibacteria bacterium RIFCSPLOWO2_01_FULL_45_43]
MMANPQTDWKIVFTSTLILVIIAVALSILVFVKIDKEEVFVSGYGANRALDTSLLEDTVDYYENKAEEFEKIKTNKTSVVDPSI